MKDQQASYYIDSNYIQSQLKHIIKTYERYMLKSSIHEFEGYKLLKEIETLQGELDIERIIMTTRSIEDRQGYTEKYSNTTRLLRHISDYIKDLEFEREMVENE